MPEGPGRRLGTGNFVTFRMPAKDRSRMTKRVEMASVEKAFIGEKNIKRDAAMPLAKDTAIAQFPIRLIRPIRHDVVEQHAQYLNQ